MSDDYGDGPMDADDPRTGNVSDLSWETIDVKKTYRFERGPDGMIYIVSTKTKTKRKPFTSSSNGDMTGSSHVVVASNETIANILKSHNLE